jgi:hypothetical protein
MSETDCLSVWVSEFIEFIPTDLRLLGPLLRHQTHHEEAVTSPFFHQTYK